MPSPIRSTLVLLSLAGVACGTQPAPVTGPRAVITPQGLEQSVRLSPPNRPRATPSKSSRSS